MEKNSKQTWYLESYDYFVSYFENINCLKKQDIIFAISMAYSWMPKIPRIPKITKEMIEIINVLSKNIDTEKLQELKGMINNSIVGTSKSLHFINPKVYPIWDSKVCKAFSKKRNLKFKSDKIENYLEYKKFLDEEIRNKKPFFYMKKWVSEKFEVSIDSYSDYRIIDLYVWNNKTFDVDQ